MQQDRERSTLTAPQGRARWWMAGFASVLSARALGLAFLPLLLIHAPLLLLGLSPFAAHLVLVTPKVSPLLYFSIGVGASVLQAAIGYHFGVALGARARPWLEARGAATRGASLRLLRGLERATPVILILFPGPMVAVLAGVARVSAARFYPLMILAQLLWVGACFSFGEALTDQIALAEGFIKDHLLLLSAITLSWVGGQQLWGWWRRRRESSAPAAS